MNAPSLALPSASLDDDALAHALASGAAEVLMALRAEVDAAGGSFVAKALKDAGDAAAQAWLAAALAAARPVDAVLSEEAKDDASRTGADRVWIIDPLDGTREFAERHADGPLAGQWRDDFAVHIALWQRGAGLTAGAVALPARAQVLTTADGVVRDDDAAAVLAGNRPLRIAASRSRPPEFVAALAERDDVELVPMGSAGVKMLRGRRRYSGRLRPRGWAVRVGLCGPCRRCPVPGARLHPPRRIRARVQPGEPLAP